MDIFGFNAGEISALVLALVGLARVIVKLTPTPKDDAIFAKVYNILKNIGFDDTPLSKR